MKIGNVGLMLVSLSLICLSGCSTWNKLDKTEKGAVIGTAGGATVGGATGGAGGALLGGAVGGVTGGVIGHHVEKDDERERRRR